MRVRLIAITDVDARISRGITRTILLMLFLLVGVTSAAAQQFTGGVRGAVSDPNGVVPGVTVTLTNEATNISREVVTNEAGQYNFPAVPPGTYTLKASHRLQNI